MVKLEKMCPRKFTGANYITSVNGMIHPNRVMQEHDFLYILEGSWEIFEDETQYLLNSDDLLILTAGRHHRGGKPCNPGNRHMYFHVIPTGAELKNNTEEKMDNLEIEQEKESDLLQCGSLIHCQNHPAVRNFFLDLVDTYLSQGTERENKMSLFFNLLLSEVSELQGSTNSALSSDPIVDEVRRQIRSNPQISYTAGEMAERFFICARTLNNHFLKSCGRTFAAYQMDLKLEMVREFLMNQPDAKLREAALNFGFYDEFHLSKSFKKKYGQSPSKIRK